MPINKVPRYKVVHCNQCPKTKTGKRKVIKRFDRQKYKGGHVPKDKILEAIRRHYKKYHPRKFRESTKKAVKTKKESGRMGKKKKGKKSRRKTYKTKKAAKNAAKGRGVYKVKGGWRVSKK